MKVLDGGLPGVLLIEPRVFEDERGAFHETWQRERYRAAGIDRDFVQANHARSRARVLRGLHYQLGRPQAKLVWAVSGEVFDVAVDLRRESPTFGRWCSALLSGANRRQIYVPEGFAHGYCVTSAEAEVAYLCSDLYAPGGERGVRWDDPALGIAWPVKDPVVSAKDRALPLLKDAELPVPHPLPTLPPRGGGEQSGGERAIPLPRSGGERAIPLPRGERAG